MRRTTMTAVGVSALLVAATLPAAGAGPATEDSVGQAGLTVPGGLPARPGATDRDDGPAGPNPYLALLPDPEAADYAAWSAHLAAESARSARSAGASTRADGATASAQGRKDRPLVVREREPVGTVGRNDTPRTAQQVTGFGTGRRENPAAQVLGWLASSSSVSVPISPNVEDDGAIPLARDTGVGESVGGVTTSGVVGDGPHGSAGTGTGDFDAYRVRGIAGQQLVVDVDTPEGDLDSLVILYTGDGEVVDVSFAADVGGDHVLSHEVAADRDYVVFVSGYDSAPNDPFDSGSGTGATSEGPYVLGIRQDPLDTDVYAVELEPGDVLGLSVSGAATQLQVFERDGTQVQGSSGDVTALYPMESPLPGGGNAVLDHVADVRGWHYLAVRGSGGEYDLTAEVYRPGLEGQRHPQTVFLDFDGARVNTAVFGGPGVRQLSPLRSFLPAWGLRDADHKPLVRQIVATVTENLERDLRRTGAEVRILNSLEHRDPFGQDNVSRVIVGGTIAESGIPTIGIAQSIDPGNFDQEETALVLLDILSAGPDEVGDASLNYYLTPRSDRVRFIGQAIGNITSHEAGHFLGSWHVDQYNDVLNLMDQGGNFPLLYGAGPDGIGGTRDDWDVDFGEDRFVPDEGFTGLENTLSRTALALTLRPIPPR